MKNVQGPLAHSIDLYLAHKRALGKQLVSVEAILRLLDGYLLAQGAAELCQISSSQARHLLHKLVDTGALRLAGQKRGAYYERN